MTARGIYVNVCMRECGNIVVEYSSTECKTELILEALTVHSYTLTHLLTRSFTYSLTHLFKQEVSIFGFGALSLIREGTIILVKKLGEALAWWATTFNQSITFPPMSSLAG